MNRPLLTATICVAVTAGGLLSRASEIELTGLIDIGSCRLACIRVGSTGQLVTLHEGEAAADVLLEQIDTEAGWAQVRQGDKHARVWLHSCASPIASAPVSNVRELRRQAALARLGQADESGQASEALPNNTGGRVAIYAPQGEVIQTLAGSQDPPERLILLPGPAQTLLANSLPQPSVASPVDATSVVPGREGNQVPSGLPGEPASTKEASATASTDTAGDAPSGITARSDPAASDRPLTEGEQIRAYYGTAAFLSWDMARYHRENPSL